VAKQTGNIRENKNSKLQYEEALNRLHKKSNKDVSVKPIKVKFETLLVAC